MTSLFIQSIKKNIITFCTIPLLILIFSPAYAQFESNPCKCCDDYLKKLFRGKSLEVFYAPSGSASSSFLLPDGPAPKIIPATDAAPPDDAAYEAWTCRYSSSKITDNDPKTAWVEGADGQGIGEVLIIECLDLGKPVKIWAGYGKSAGIFTSNSRPKTIRIVIASGETRGATQNGMMYENLKVIAEKVVSLNDINGYQSLPLPVFKTETYFSIKLDGQMEYKYFLGIEILEVYPGSKYKDTCISEIVNK